MMDFKNVLAIGAHPDDIEFSCLGLLYKLHKQGSQVNVFIASNGSSGDPSSSAIRISESRLALSCINPNFIFNNTSGVNHSDFESISNKVRQLLLDIKPDLILVHSQHDTHQEHRFLRDMVITATRRIPCTILSYKSVSVTASYEENFFVDISDEFDLKLESILQHSSQLHHDYMTSDFIKQFHVNWFAKLRGLNYVESYHLEQAIF